MVAIVVIVLTFRNGVRGAAITPIVVDDTIVRWMSDIDLPGIHGIARAVSYASSWWVIEITVWAFTVALIVFRRWRHLLIYLLVSQVAQMVHARLSDLTTQPRPFGVPLRGSWGGWSMPSFQMLSLAGLSVIALYTLVPAGQPRNRLKWVVAVIVILVALARLYLGVDSPSAIVVGVLIGVSFALTAFRYFAPSEVFPGDVPPGANRAPRRRRPARRGHPQGGRGPAGPDRVRDQARGAERVSGLDAAAPPGGRRVFAVPLRQALLAPTCARTAGTSWDES